MKSHNPCSIPHTSYDDEAMAPLSAPPTLLIVHHSPTSSMQQLTDAVVAGARDDAITGVDVRPLEALAFARGEADHTDVLAAQGYILGTPANFGYMSGALKHFFDSTFLHIGGALDDSGGASGASSSSSSQGPPFGLYLHGRYDLTGARRAVEGIVGALGWRQGFNVVESLGPITQLQLEQAYELGGTIAALIAERH